MKYIKYFIRVRTRQVNKQRHKQTKKHLNKIKQTNKNVRLRQVDIGRFDERDVSSRPWWICLVWSCFYKQKRDLSRCSYLRENLIWKQVFLKLCSFWIRPPRLFSLFLKLMCKQRMVSQDTFMICSSTKDASKTCLNSSQINDYKF